MRLHEGIVCASQRLACIVSRSASALGIHERGVLLAKVDCGAQLLLAHGGFLGVLQGVFARLVGLDQLVADGDHQPIVHERQRAVTLAGLVGIVGQMIDLPARQHGALRNHLDRLLQLLGHVLRAANDHAGTERRGAAAEVQGADDVLRVVQVVAVDLDRLAGRRLVVARLHPGRITRGGDEALRALAQHHNVGHHFRAGVLLECAGRQADGRDQLGLLGKLAANCGVLLVHRARGRDADHDPARANLIHGLQEEVVMEHRVQLVVAAIGNRRVLERPVPDDQIVEAVGRLRVLIAHDPHVRAREKLLGNRAGRLVQFDAGQLAARLQVGRHHAEEVAGAHGGLQHLATLEAHAAHHVPHGQHGRRVGVVRVGDRALGGLPGGLAQGVAQPLAALLPDALVLVDGALPRTLEQLLAERSPPDVAGEHLLFVRRRLTTFFGQRLKQLERGAVAIEALNRRAADDLKRVVDVQILRLRRRCGGRTYASQGSSASGSSGSSIR